MEDVSTLMPLLTELINFPSMVGHCINITCKLTAKLNPLQTPAITADQPVYALAKKVQCVIMLGPLHIEMAFLFAIGDWLESTTGPLSLKERKSAR